MSKSLFKAFDLSEIKTIEEAKSNLRRQHVNSLLRLFGNDMCMLSKRVIDLYFKAAAELILEKNLGVTRKTICEKIIKTYTYEKMCGKLEGRSVETYQLELLKKTVKRRK